MLKSRRKLLYFAICALCLAIGWVANECLRYVEAFFPGSPGISVIKGGRYYAKIGGYGVLFRVSRSENGDGRAAFWGVVKLKPDGLSSEMNAMFIPRLKEGFTGPEIALSYRLPKKRTVFLTEVGLNGRWLTKTVMESVGGVSKAYSFVRLKGQWVSGGHLHPPYFDYEGIRYQYNGLEGHWTRLGNLTKTLDRQTIEK